MGHFPIVLLGEANAKLKVNASVIPFGKNFRFAHRQRLEGTDLIIWLKTHSTQPLILELDTISDEPA